MKERLEQILVAFKENNYQRVLEITMEESNEFHGVCMATTPPIMYLNKFSFDVIDTVH